MADGNEDIKKGSHKVILMFVSLGVGGQDNYNLGRSLGAVHAPVLLPLSSSAGCGMADTPIPELVFVVFQADRKSVV